jgi:hypothetical protein
VHVPAERAQSDAHTHERSERDHQRAGFPSFALPLRADVLQCRSSARLLWRNL